MGAAGEISRNRRYSAERAQALRRFEVRHAPVLAALVVRGGSESPGARNWLETFQIIIKSQVEIDAAHLAVGDAVEPCAELVVDREPYGVSQGFLAVGRPEAIGVRGHLADEVFVPARERPTADHRTREDRLRHR